MFKKITEGYVVQVFDDTGKCKHQKFVTGDEVQYDKSPTSNATQSIIDSAYYPFEMEVPG